MIILGDLPVIIIIFQTTTFSKMVLLASPGDRTLLCRVSRFETISTRAPNREGFCPPTSYLMMEAVPASEALSCEIKRTTDEVQENNYTECSRNFPPFTEIRVSVLCSREPEETYKHGAPRKNIVTARNDPVL
jgi:hypothetical protein